MGTTDHPATKGLGIRAISHKKFCVCTTDSNRDSPIAANAVNRDFTALKSNEIWLADITCVPTREGRLYLAVVEDLYSRRVVGWSMGGGRRRAGSRSMPWRWR